MASIPSQDAVAVYDPLAEMTWTDIVDYGGVSENGSAHYRDVVGHTNPADPSAPRSSGLAFYPDSVAIHETGHMLHYQIRQLVAPYDDRYEGLYYRDGKGFVIAKPALRITDFAGAIPQALRGPYSPYQGYVVDQPRNYPTLNNVAYLFNEWGAYIMNIRMVLELEAAGRPEDGSSGHGANNSPYFFGYIAYGMHMLQTQSPAALNDRQFKAAFALYAQQTWELMAAASSSPVFGPENPIFGEPLRATMAFYRTSAEFAPVRASLAAIYGSDWVERLMAPPAPAG